jgi:hypothetical protein
LESTQAPSTPAVEDRVPPDATDMLRRHEEGIAEHRAEPLDLVWSRTTGEAFMTDYLKKMANTSFKLVSVDCRSVTCAVELEWPSFAQASAEWKRALMQPTQAPCARRVVVPEPAPGQTGPVRATIVMDCTTWVANGSRLMAEDELPVVP